MNSKATFGDCDRWPLLAFSCPDLFPKVAHTNKWCVMPYSRVVSTISCESPLPQQPHATPSLGSHRGTSTVRKDVAVSSYDGVLVSFLVTHLFSTGSMKRQTSLALHAGGGLCRLLLLHIPLSNCC